MRGSLSCALLAALLLSSLLAIPAPADAEVARPAEDFLAEYRGQTVLVDFWASWCGPCLRSFPWMNQMSDKYRARGFTVIAVNLDARAEDAAAFLAQHPVNFTIEYDAQGILAESFGVEAMPSSYLIDASGKIVAEHKGFLTKNTQDYERLIFEQLESDNP